ncbi:hypothetical protein PAXINDRAFT_97078 [Paxillus involutus ATCC 200175]|nr:hypothetical protein PAXINDRAFT_97078 [Paxillus involutus ATCC 200175]
MGSATAQRKGVWEPLPLIVYGYAVHPLSPSKRDTRISSRRPMSTITEGSNDEGGVHRDVVSLEVGDEVYAFEKYTPRGKEVEGVWYRGSVFIDSVSIGTAIAIHGDTEGALARRSLNHTMVHSDGPAALCKPQFQGD